MLILREVSSVARTGRVATNAGVECCMALWTASAPESEPLSATARRLVELLPPQRRLTATRLNRLVPGWALHAASWFYRTDAADFRDALATLRTECASRLACDLVMGPLMSPDHAGADLRGAHARRSRAMVLVLRQPEDMVGDVMDVLEAFWSAGFCRFWQQERSRLAALCERIGPRVESDLAGALLALSPRAVGDGAADRLVFLGGQCSWTIPCGDLSGVDVVPSLWLRRRVVALYSSDRAAVCLPAGSRSREWPGSTEVASVLGVLADPRRLEILRMCMHEPLCTQELARRLGITEGPVSRHLKQLEARGLVVGQRFGRQVTYAAVPEEMAQVAEVLRTIGRAPQAAEPVALSAARAA